MIGAFLSGTTFESLVHKLGCKGPRTTKELLDITTNHASGGEVVRAIFDRLVGKARWDEGTSEGTSNRSTKRKNKKQQREDSLMAIADRKGVEAHGGYTGPLREATRRAMPEPFFTHQAPIPS